MTRSNCLFQTALRQRLCMVCAVLLLMSCNAWAPQPQAEALLVSPTLPAADALPLSTAHAEVGSGQPVGPQQPAEAVSLASVEAPSVEAPTPAPTAAVATAAVEQPAGAGEPAGCLSAAEQAALPDVPAMLARADELLGLSGSLNARLLPNTYNAYQEQFVFDTGAALTISVDRVENEFVIQKMLNALHVSGFVTWLRRTSSQRLHILAVPLRGPAVMQSVWEPYIRAYWRDRTSLPSGDPYVLPALRLPPCAWMVAGGFAPMVDGSWWAADAAGWPDYARAAAAYLAPTSDDAARVAREINWLGDRSPEGPNTMCGPLAWSILASSGAFPPGWGGWSAGAKAFWLAKPSENGRPWSLFPKDAYTSHRFAVPLGEFDFDGFPLYPGDFLYTYSKRDGFDHMFVVTETDELGNVYTVTNLVHMVPENRTTIERVLLYNRNDPSLGIARNQWANDRVNGRTGHAGFEVFRWAWMEKDITGKPGRYTAQPGDTYGLVAALWKTPARVIAEYNGDRMDSSLLVGQEILIPPNAPGMAGWGFSPAQTLAGDGSGGR